MNDILKQYNIPGSEPRPIILKRKSSSNKNVELQLELDLSPTKEANK